jgi:hypothetical protein
VPRLGAGYVTRFRGLEELNDNIVGLIELAAEYR